MMFVTSIKAPIMAAAVVTSMAPRMLDLAKTDTVKGVSKNILEGILGKYYTGTDDKFVDIAKPYYWWQAGALMGSIGDYMHYTGDPSYERLLVTALSKNVGPHFDYIVPEHHGDEGNDDLGFWGFAVMSAAERNLPQPNPAIPAWLDLGANIFNSLVSRWNTSACGGGLLWQMFADNINGLNYRNAVSNGGLFQLAARLARATGNTTYVEWADKVYDWMTDIKMIGDDHLVYDGADSKENCSSINPISFSYSQAIFLYGAAVMANHTGDQKWVDRTLGLLDASRSYFSPFKNATNIMYEHACEQVYTCNNDMKSFKAYMSRFMWASTQMVPAILPVVTDLLHTSARAAAAACSGGPAGNTCGERWYTGGFDGSRGLGQQMGALEVIQGSLIGQAVPPLRGADIKVVRTFSPLDVESLPTPTPGPTDTPDVSSAASPAGRLRFRRRRSSFQMRG